MSLKPSPCDRTSPGAKKKRRKKGPLPATDARWIDVYAWSQEQERCDEEPCASGVYAYTCMQHHTRTRVARHTEAAQSARVSQSHHRACYAIFGSRLERHVIDAGPLGETAPCYIGPTRRGRVLRSRRSLFGVSPNRFETPLRREPQTRLAQTEESAAAWCGFVSAGAGWLAPTAPPAELVVGKNLYGRRLRSAMALSARHFKLSSSPRRGSFALAVPLFRWLVLLSVCSGSL